MYKLLLHLTLTKVNAQAYRQSDDDISLANLPSASAIHSPVIEAEFESITEFDSEDDQTIANTPTKMTRKDQLTDQNQTNKVRRMFQVFGENACLIL